MRLVVVLCAATVPALLVWAAFDGPGWVEDGPSYRFVTLTALTALVAAFAAVLLATVRALAGEPFGLLTSRRPDPVSALWLAAMLAAGLATCAAVATQQGDTAWEPSDRGWALGWALHFLVVGALLVLLWWVRVAAVWIVVTPVLTGLLGFLVAPPGGWVEEDADFRDDAVLVDGLRDVLPYTLATALLLGLLATAAVAHARARPSARSGSPGEQVGSAARDS